MKNHNLVNRMPAGALVEAAGACGLQNSPPGSAELALSARVSELAPGELEQQLADTRQLIQLWSLRASPYIIPLQDIPVFTTGLMPDNEESLRYFIYGAIPALENTGLSATNLVNLTGQELLPVLQGRKLTKDQLGLKLARQVATHLPQSSLATWQGSSPYAANQTLGESLVRFVLPVLALQGLICFAPRQGNLATQVLTTEWLAKPLPFIPPQSARAELVRRFLHCYGPSTARDFGQWAGIFPTQAVESWKLVEPETTEIKLGGKATRLLANDLESYNSTTPSPGVRFLPPHDPFLAQPDRDSLVPPPQQKLFWKFSGNPGGLLLDGELLAAWRPQKKGRQLSLNIFTLKPLPAESLAGIKEEAERMAALRGCELAGVKISES